MRPLIIAATENEVKRDLIDKEGAEFLVTGVGIPATLYHLQKRLQQGRIGFIIQAGIGGSFDESIGLGEVVLVKQDCFADLGIEEGQRFRTVFEMGFADENGFPFTGGWLVNANPIVAGSHLKAVSGITVNRVSDSKFQKQQGIDCFSPSLESMEGAALHYVCLQENVPFIQIRAVSNFVGERDKSKWKTREAIANLNHELRGLLHAIKAAHELNF